MPDLGPLVEALSPFLSYALRSFLKTTVGMITLGVAAMGGCYYLAAQGSALRGLLAVLLALVTFAVIGVMLAMKRAVLAGLLGCLRKNSLGQRSLRLVFDRMLGVSEAKAMGARGGAVAQTVERLPLAQAEGMLREAVAGLLAPIPEAGLRGWLRRRAQAGLLEKVEALTLARFREAGAKEGGVDLVKVRDELAARADALLEDQVSGMMKKLTLMLVVAALAISAVGALGISKLEL